MFWDASAIVPLLQLESTSAWLTKLWRDNSTVRVWWATEVECASALARQERLSPNQAASKSRDAFRRLAEFFPSCEVVGPNLEVKSLAVRLLRVHALRAADALQLAAAITAAAGRPGGKHFLTLDARLRIAAEIEGFTVPLPIAS